MNQAFLDYYRCPERFARFTLLGELSKAPGFFRFGEHVLCYGSSVSGWTAPRIRPVLPDALPKVVSDGDSLRLSFDPSEVVENLRRERYISNSHGRHAPSFLKRNVWYLYHLLRPALSIAVRKHFQRFHLRHRTSLPFPSWPVDRTVDSILEALLVLTLQARGVERIPFIWFWPDGAPACAMITHDVEAQKGKHFCSALMDLDDAAGIKSSFEIVPEKRYPVSASFLDGIRGRGFEINVHDLNHDGHLFADRDLFLHRAGAINGYARAFGALGFRSGGMYRNPDWINDLDFSYDMSSPSVAHLEPQQGGCCTIMPFFIGRVLELPLTALQDYSLFHILNTYSLDLWKRQIALIKEKHGLVSFIIHPDYVIERRARAAYQALLEYLTDLRADGALWIALPSEINTWWRQRHRMRVVQDGSTWRIEGEGRERARLAFATLVGDTLAFTIEQPK